MKLLLLILFSLSVFTGFSQSVTQTAVVATTTQLQSYNGTAILVFVTQDDFVGQYYVYTGADPVDGVTVFTRARGGKWKKVAGGSGSTETADEGLEKIGSEIRLGVTSSSIVNPFTANRYVHLTDKTLTLQGDLSDNLHPILRLIDVSPSPTVPGSVGFLEAELTLHTGDTSQVNLALNGVVTVNQNLPGSASSTYSYGLMTNRNYSGSLKNPKTGSIGMLLESFFLQGGTGVPLQELHLLHDFKQGGGVRFLTYEGLDDGTFQAVSLKANSIWFSDKNSVPALYIDQNGPSPLIKPQNGAVLYTDNNAMLWKAPNGGATNTLNVLKLNASDELEAQAMGIFFNNVDMGEAHIRTVTGASFSLGTAANRTGTWTHYVNNEYKSFILDNSANSNKFSIGVNSTAGGEGGFVLLNSTAGTVQFRTFNNATENNLVVRNGRIGVGIIDPQYNLDVLGTGKFTGSVLGVTEAEADSSNFFATTRFAKRLAITKVNTSAISVDGTFASNSDALIPTEKAVKTYADNLTLGLLNDRGNYDASGNVFPSTGGSGGGGAVNKGDIWTISVTGTLGGVTVLVGDQVRALVNTPGQTAGNWALTATAIGYVAENQANKSTSTSLGTSNTLYPSQNAVYVFARDPNNIVQTSSFRFATDTEKGTWNGKQDALGFTAVPNTRTVNGYALSGNITILKSDVSLGNADNTSDVNKPVSTAQQTALDLKQNLSLKDASNGYVGKTLHKHNFVSTSGSFTSFLVNSSSASRTYTFQDRDGTVADLTDIGLKANLASPTFTGTPTLPTGTIATTQSPGTNNTTIATTAYADAIAALKANLASPTFTGTPTLPTGTIGVTQSAGNSTTALATTAFATTADNLKANIASPTFTGLVTTPLIKITSGVPGAGKVLTSDPDGDATWETLTGGGDVLSSAVNTFTQEQKITETIAGASDALQITNPSNNAAAYGAVKFFNDVSGTTTTDGGALFYTSSAHGIPTGFGIWNFEAGAIAFATNALQRFTINADGTLNAANLAGTGTRIVLADATGNITAPTVTYAPLASPTFTGTPAAPTAAAGTNTTQLATTAFVQAASNNASWRTLTHAGGSHVAARVAGTYWLGYGTAAGITGTGTLYTPTLIYIDAADYPTVDGKTTDLRIRAQVEVNDVAPTGNYTIGLYPVTRPGTSGGAAVLIYTMGTVVASSTVLFTTPAADAQLQAVSAEFAVPSTGWYVLGMITTATVATSSLVHIHATLQMRNQ